jgi:uncharacterized linocin/CFP29 family protein
MQVAESSVKGFIDRASVAVTEAASKGRAAARFVPRYKLNPTTKQVIADVIVHNGTVNDVDTIPLTEIWVPFLVDWQWLGKDGMSPAISQARLAGQTYGRLEDRLLFLGQDKNLALNGGALPPGVRIERGWPNDGLLSAPKLYGNKNDIYSGVAAAFGRLEAQAATGPFAIVMGSDLADKSEETPTNFTDSHRKRIERLLGSTVIRSTVIPSWIAILLSGAKSADASSGDSFSTGPVDRAVAVEPEVRHLGRIDDKGRYEFWVVGTLALRLKDAWGIFQILFQ